MKVFLYTGLACILMPFMLVGTLIYGLLYVLQLLFRTINLQFEKGMRWIDKNITPNIR